MGFTSNTLPPERARFWGGRIIPTHGVMKTEWWPNEQEETLVAKIVTGEEYLNYLVALYGEVNASKVQAQFDQYELFDWFTGNFTRDGYTSDYSIELNEAMVWRGVNEFHEKIAKPWLIDAVGV